MIDGHKNLEFAPPGDYNLTRGCSIGNFLKLSASFHTALLRMASVPVGEGVTNGLLAAGSDVGKTYWAFSWKEGGEWGSKVVRAGFRTPNNIAG